MPGSPNAVAVVLARAASKGLAHKNRLPVGGRPCAAWTLEHALACGGVARVGLSTDDGELADLARSMGVEHWPRSAHAATDSARVDEAARDALGRAELAAPLAPDAPIVLLYANVPVRPAGLLDRALELFARTGCDSVQSYAPVGKHHPWWTVRLLEDGAAAPWQGESLFAGVHRRQDLPEAYVPDGGVLVVKRSVLAAAAHAHSPHAFLGRDHRGVATEPGAVVDIDTALDLAVADRVLSGAAMPAAQRGAYT